VGLLGLFRKSGKSVASIRFAFPHDFETSYHASVSEDGRFPEGFENWVWDLFYAKALYTLGKSQIADGLKSQLETWAEEHVTVLLSGLFPVPEEIFSTLDPDLKVAYNRPHIDDEVYQLIIIENKPSRRNPDAWPTIETVIPREGFQNRFASSVLVLADGMMIKNSYFTRMLPLHVLSMRSFYNRQDYGSIRSIFDAPSFAIEEERYWTTSARPRILQQWNEVQSDQDS
jgi:hypothetical protein